jgi:VWFA-related protein
MLCAIGAQEIQHEAVAINIEVPVRVFKGDTFIDSLTIDDFEVYEDGVLQNVDAVYLIKKTDIERKEERKGIWPPLTERHYYLFFEIIEFDAKIRTAIDYFFRNVIGPNDSCTIVTPLKTIILKKEALAAISVDRIVEQLSGILRKDAWMGSSDYRSAVRELTSIIMQLHHYAGTREGQPTTSGLDLSQFGVDFNLEYYATILQSMETMRRIDQEKIMQFADYLKEIEGKKYVFLFYQREFLPKLDPQAFDIFVTMMQDQMHIGMMTTSLYALYHRDISIDAEAIKQAYADSSIGIHFLFYSKLADALKPGIRYEEHSEDVFNLFNEMAIATGGLTVSSSNPEFLFKKAHEASENYYLLYYTPKDYKADGIFKNIKVKVKGDGYKVTHRIGYFAK